MAKRPVGRPEKFPGEEIVFEAFKLPRSLKDRFNRIAHILRCNKTDIFIEAIREYIAKNEQYADMVSMDYVPRKKSKVRKKAILKKIA